MVKFPHVLREFEDSYPTALTLLYTSTLEVVASSFEAAEFILGPALGAGPGGGASG